MYGFLCIILSSKLTELWNLNFIMALKVCNISFRIHLKTDDHYCTIQKTFIDHKLKHFRLTHMHLQKLKSSVKQCQFYSSFFVYSQFSSFLSQCVAPSLVYLCISCFLCFFVLIRIKFLICCKTFIKIYWR